MNRSVNTQLQSTSTAVAYLQASSSATTDRISMVDITAVIADATPSDKTFDTGTMAVHTATFPTKAGAVNTDYLVAYDSAGLAWAVALDTSGSATTPTGAAWAAIPAGRKAIASNVFDTSAADVAATCKSAFESLTGFTAAITITDPVDGTLVLTQVVPGVTTLGSDYSAAGAAGSGTTLAIASTTTGIATEVSPSANTVTIPSHGYTTGAKITALTTTGTLPAGLSTGTVYYVIAVDSNTIKFATSQANALAGTAVDITGYGATTSVNTVDIAATVAGTIKLQKNNNPPEVTAVWVDLVDAEVKTGTAAPTYTGAATKNWLVSDLAAREIRVYNTVTSGAVTTDIRLHGKNA